MTREEVVKIVENSKAPKGIVAQSANGQLFFLGAEDAKRMAIPSNAPYSEFLSSEFKKATSPGGVRERFTEESCNRILDWLTTAPRDEVWMGVAREYIAKCL